MSIKGAGARKVRLLKVMVKALGKTCELEKSRCDAAKLNVCRIPWSLCRKIDQKTWRPKNVILFAYSGVGVYGTKGKGQWSTQWVGGGDGSRG